MKIIYKFDIKNLISLITSIEKNKIILAICNLSRLSDKIDSLTGLIAYKTPSHEIIHCNKKALLDAGYRNEKNIIGKKDVDLVWQEYASIYHAQEDDALENKIYTALHPGTDIDGRNFLYLNRKYPWYDENGNLIGVISHAVEITDPILIEIVSILNIITNPKNTQYVNKSILNYNLSPRESECLFYLVRGKTAKVIAKILGISHRTVEVYIEHLKNKLNCNTKAELIDEAIKIGFVNIIPNSVLNYTLLNSLKCL